MTRKQAICQAIQALSALEEKEESITLLQDIYDEMPLIHWSDKSIRDTVEQFIVDNGRIPTASDFRKKGMPPYPVIKNKYGITLAEWLRINYPQPEKNIKVEMTDITQIIIYLNKKQWIDWGLIQDRHFIEKSEFSENNNVILTKNKAAIAMNNCRRFYSKEREFCMEIPIKIVSDEKGYHLPPQEREYRIKVITDKRSRAFGGVL